MTFPWNPTFHADFYIDKLEDLKDTKTPMIAGRKSFCLLPRVAWKIGIPADTSMAYSYFFAAFSMNSRHFSQDAAGSSPILNARSFLSVLCTNTRHFSAFLLTFPGP